MLIWNNQPAGVSRQLAPQIVYNSTSLVRANILIMENYEITERI